MKKIFTTCTAMLAVLALFAQSSAGFWSESNRSSFTQPAFMPQQWRALDLNLDAMRNYLRQAPMEFTDATPLEVSLPMPDGTMQPFEVWESPIMEPGLAERYPMIKTFSGKNSANPNITTRFSFSTQGFNGILHLGEKTALISPNTPEEQVYLSYWLKDVDLASPDAQQFHCEVEHSSAELESFTESSLTAAARSAAPVQLFTYRLAVATTDEYSQEHGNTPASVLSAVTVVVNNINSVFERDAAIRMVLIANTDLAFQYSSSDPYTNGNTSMMIDQNPPVLNAAFTVNGYDIGHVFGTNGGGLANLASVCNGAGGAAGFPKARGVSCSFGPYTTDLFYIIAGHEMGHQFNATHTFNKCDDENETPETAYEPGSGSSIMCYNGNGVCGNNHVQPITDDYFHINSMLRIQEFSRTGGGSTCNQVVGDINNTPEANIPMEGDFYIPISTPFSLTGEGTDQDDPSTVTYTWEQYDLGPPSPLGSPIGSAPLFRWYPPTENPTRIFPKIETIISNTNDIREVLPTTSRLLTFRFVVRDNQIPPGAFNYEEIVFNSTAAAGPFLVTYPNALEVFDVGETIQATWDVASTNIGPVNCQKVNIHLSTDGGFTYPTLLVAGTANDGSATVTLPNLPTNAARIRVEAADNIFFDISNQNFVILAPAQPGYLLNVGPLEGGVACDEYVFNVETEALLNYNGQINFTLGGPPVGITANFNPNPVTAGQSTTLTINTSNATQTGIVQLNLLATSSGQPDQVRNIALNIVDTDLSGITATSPSDGASGQETLPNFTWTDLPNADSYEIQIATDPGFTNIVDDATGLTTNQYTPTITLESNQIYYWRVKAINLCGESGFGDPFSFRTVSQTCIDLTSSGDQNNITIPGTGLPLISSIINIAQAGSVADVNVNRVKGTHSSVRNVEIRLKGPDGTSVVLLSEPNCNSSAFNNCGFDDQSPSTLVNCPQNNAKYKPVGSLSAFNGKNSQGDWTLEVEVVDSEGEGGKLDEWDLEVCAGLQSTNPTIIKNDTLYVPPSGTNRIYTNTLTANDADNTWSDLEFTIVTNTAFGQVKLNGQVLGVGDHFTMYDVFNNYVSYTNTAPAATYDYFTFNVNDGGGGFAGTPRFNIVMDPDAVIISNTDNLSEIGNITISPNPAKDELNIAIDMAAGNPISANLLDVQGREITTKTSINGTVGFKMNTSDLAPGLYFVQVKTTKQTIVRKVVIID